MARVVIGVDPHKASNTLVVIDEQERVLDQQRFPNDRAGYRSMKSFARTHRDRVWAVEGARGVGAGLAQRLVAEGERVIDVPARLSARVRALGGGSGRKTDDADAYAVAVAGLRGKTLQPVRPDDTTEILRMLTTRRQEVVELRIATVNRLHEVLCQLVPGGAKRHLSPSRARSLLSAVRPRDAVGKARKQLALDYTGELERLDARRKDLKKQISDLLTEHPTTLLEVTGLAAVTAAKILAEVGDVRRFPSKHHFASYTGTAPIDVSSGDNNRHRLNRGGNRRLNHAVHIAAVVQYRMPGPGQDYYRRKRDAGKTHNEALRCLKRRISDVVYRCLIDDLAVKSPGGQVGASVQSSATDLIPIAGTSEQPLSGLTADHTPAVKAAS
ncbi:MAG TPA: IS110 family transposase [Mycobacteriales bacterium]|nr:IS110 family transposase [Mycobacteriales bacterium]